MRGFLFLLLFVCLSFALPAHSQTAFGVDKTKLVATLKSDALVVGLPVSSRGKIQSVNVRLEVLDENDASIARNETSVSLRAGAQMLSIPIIIATNTDKLLWYRLRYNISQPDSLNSITNTVALSEITPEVFELQVTAPRSVFAGMNVRVHVLAINPYTKKPIRNVDVTGKLELELDTDDDVDELKLAVKTNTNSDGIATIEFKIPASIKLEDWGADLAIEGKKNGVVRKAENDLDVSQDAFAYLQTDKPIYQPNQKLSARCLFLNSSRRPIAGQELSIEIRDEEGSTVLERTVATSRFGIANFEWALPGDIKLGKYVIEVEDDSDEVGRAEFRVSRYDLPNFVVNAKAAKSFYLLNEGIAEVTVDAKYLFGKPVAAGQVKVIEEYSRKWNFETQSWEIGQGVVYEGETDADGKFTTEVGLGDANNRLRQEEWKRFDDVHFTAYFTDATTNRTEQRRFDIRISKEPIHIYFIRPAADPSAAIPFQFYVSTFYADGTPAKTNLNVSGFYENATTDERLAEAKTNSYGAAKFEFEFPAKPFDEAKNNFNLRIKATDANGRIGILADNVYITEKRQIRVKTDKTIYAPSDPIFAKILTTEKGPLFIDVAKDSNVIWSKQITVNDGVGGVTIPYRPDFKGELTITAYSYDEDENADFSLWSKTILFPKPAELDLNLKAVKATYRPGEDARLVFNVRDAFGVGAESALGIVMLDEAIEERARTEQLPDNLADLRKLLGTADAFGDLTRSDLDKIDTSKPISADLQLAAEYLLSRSYSRPRSFSSESYTEDFGSMYRPLLQKQLTLLTDALRKRYQEGSEYPADVTQLAAFASATGIEMNEIRDAWGSPYIATFRRERGDDVLELLSASADRKVGTSDDFLVTDIRFQWFLPTLNRISKLTGLGLPDGPKPRTVEEVGVLISKAGFDLTSVKDDSGRPVQINSRTYTRESVKTWLETVGNFDGAMQQVPRSKAVTQEVVVHNFVSGGQDGIVGNYDDIILGSTVTVSPKRTSKGCRTERYCYPKHRQAVIKERSEVRSSTQTAPSSRMRV